MADSTTSVPAVAVADLQHRYGDRVALGGITFEVARGTLFALLGPNGSGKSTLFKILSTLIPGDQGTARILGHDVAHEPVAVRRQLGVVFQHPSLDGLLTVEENLGCHGYLHGLAGPALGRRIDSALARLDLVARRHDRVAELSGGLRRRVELAKALLAGARVLLLDEPSTGLDPVARRDFLTHLRELRDTDGMTAVLATHDLEEAEGCDRVAIFDRGRIVGLGTPDELKAGVGGEVLVLRTRAPEALREAVRSRFGLELQLVDGTLRTEHGRGHELVRDLVEAFSGDLEAITLGKPTLGDAFVRLTGHHLDRDA